MNLREFYKKLRSPLGTTLLSLGGLILLVLLCLPLLLRNDAANSKSTGTAAVKAPMIFRVISRRSPALPVPGSRKLRKFPARFRKPFPAKNPVDRVRRPFPAVPAVRETAGPCRLIPGFPILRLRLVRLRSRSSTERTPGRNEKSSLPNGMRHTGV